jgi:hypothetical protein
LDLAQDAPTEMRVHRGIYIAQNILHWVLGLPGRPQALRVYVEDYAFGLTQNRAHELAEMTGMVKMSFYQAGMLVRPVNQSTVRKYFLGKLPPKDRAGAVHSALKGMGAPWHSSDVGDAFVVANYGRTELGLPGVTLAQ